MITKPRLGIFTKREMWTLTVRGWIVALLILASLAAWLFFSIHSFLSQNSPVDAQILVVEGWLPDYALEEAVKEFRAHPYRLVVTTGGTMAAGSQLAEFGSYADLAAATLKQHGVDPKQIAAVEAPPDTKLDRTFASALAFRQWLSASGIRMAAVNVCTLGPHARRSRLLFQMALGDGVAVGVVSIEDQTYVPGEWWKSSNGVRTVIDESIAYLYAVFFFHPSRG